MAPLGDFEMPMSFLSEHMDRLRTSVLAQAARARAGSGHAGLKGAAIEVVLRNLLRQYVPTSFTVGTGQFANSSGVLSPQMDVLLYDAAVFPHLSVNEDSSVVVCCESVFGVIECKSEWNAKELARHFSRFSSVDRASLRPGETKGAPDVERTAYFAFVLKTPKEPRLKPLEDSIRTIGVYGLADSVCWFSPRRCSSFERLEGNALELFLGHVLQDCMEKGPKESGDFGASYEIVRGYFGWRDWRGKK